MQRLVVHEIDDIQLLSFTEAVKCMEMSERSFMFDGDVYVMIKGILYRYNKEGWARPAMFWAGMLTNAWREVTYSVIVE